jgi:hypothetical protein
MRDPAALPRTECDRPLHRTCERPIRKRREASWIYFSEPAPFCTVKAQLGSPFA